MALSTSKDHPENSPEGRKAKANALAADSTAADVAALVEKEQEQGFRGVEADPTPNANYTVAGVTSGAPTPETDKAQARQVREYGDELHRKVEGVAGQDH